MTEAALSAGARLNFVSNALPLEVFLRLPGQHSGYSSTLDGGLVLQVVREDFVATSWSSWGKSQDSFLNIGYQLLAISGDGPDALVETAQKQVLNTPLLSDPDLVLMRQMGIVFQGPGKQPLPAPSVYITSPKADILFQHVDPNFRVRLDNGVILAAARAF